MGFSWRKPRAKSLEFARGGSGISPPAGLTSGMDDRITCLNGRMVRAGRAAVPVADRGFRFGDGVFETVRIERFVPYQWELHMARLAEGLRRAAHSRSGNRLGGLRPARAPAQQGPRGLPAHRRQPGLGQPGLPALPRRHARHLAHRDPAAASRFGRTVPPVARQHRAPPPPPACPGSTSSRRGSTAPSPCSRPPTTTPTTRCC